VATGAELAEEALDEPDGVGAAEDAEVESGLLEVEAAELEEGAELEAQTTDWGKSVTPAVLQMPFANAIVSACSAGVQLLATQQVIASRNDLAVQIHLTLRPQLAGIAGFAQSCAHLGNPPSWAAARPRRLESATEMMESFMISMLLPWI